MQRIAGKTFIAFSALTFSLVARAQLIEIDPPAADVVDTGDASSAVTDGSNVAVTKSMRPSTVPSAGLLNTGAGITDDGSESSDDASSVNATGNKNGPGTQINLNIQNDQAAKNAAESASLSEQGRLSQLRMEKQLREKINEERLAEKIEEDRIHGEKHRTKGIERFDFGNAEGLETVPVTSAGAGASASAGPGGASATAVATVSTDGSSGSGLFGFDTQFKIVPVIGYRWYQYAGMTQVRPYNIAMGGVGMEGVIGRYFSLEGAFLYGRDRFTSQYGYGPYGGAGYGYAGAGYGGGYPGAAVPGIGGAGCGYGCPLPQSRDSFEVNGGAKIGYQFGMVRPFVSFDVGGILNKYNIDDAYTTEYLRSIGYQRTSTHFSLIPGGGFDLRVSSSINVGARFDYQYITNVQRQAFTAMDGIWGDSLSRYRLTGSLQLVF